jgi:hypothetical protein
MPTTIARTTRGARGKSSGAQYYVPITGPRQPKGARQPQLLALLASGPMTTPELAAALGVHATLVLVALRICLRDRQVTCHPAYVGAPARGRFSLKRWTLRGAPKPPRDPIPLPPPKPVKPPKPPKVVKAKPVREPKPPKPEKAPKPPKPPKVAKVRVPKPAPPPKPTRLDRERAQLARAAAVAAVATPAPISTGRKPIAAQTVEDFIRAGGRIQQLPPVRYEPPPQMPVGWKT